MPTNFSLKVPTYSHEGLGLRMSGSPPDPGHSESSDRLRPPIWFGQVRIMYGPSSVRKFEPDYPWRTWVGHTTQGPS